MHFNIGDIPVPCEFDSILFGLDVGMSGEKMGRKWNCVGYGGYLMDLKGRCVEELREKLKRRVSMDGCVTE